MLVPGSAGFSSNCEDQSVPTVAQPSALEGFLHRGLVKLTCSLRSLFGAMAAGIVAIRAFPIFRTLIPTLPPAIPNPPSHPACSYIADYMADPHGDPNSTCGFTYTAPLSVMNSTVIPSGPSSQSPSVREHASNRGSQIPLRNLLPAPTERHLLERHEASQQKPFPCPMCPAGYERRNARTRHYKEYHNPDAEPGTGGRPRLSSRLLFVSATNSAHGI
ncbi:hypothetical protein BJX66DRAFT_91226 [Aspergillus keveii]|uniref:C2H2-type domain-containing protein n=1 Tax=Aspergillus keveii TaxID=714993 RepID=A0ABR4FLS0_9EURO